jgi:DNA-directed RNA polymerase specialized sigma24 family protein
MQRDEEQKTMKRIFGEHMSELYWLAFLLTGDREKSVQAFTGALNSDDGPPAFQQFLLSWAKRLVIVAALGTIRRQICESMLQMRLASHEDQFKGLAQSEALDLQRLTDRELEEGLLAMAAFPRCAVILTLFERIPVEEVAVLLAADKITVKMAQAQGAAELAWRLAGIVQPSPKFRGGFALKALAAWQ